MDPVTTNIIGGLGATSKVITELIISIYDKSKKSQLESAKGQVELAKAQLEAVANERDELKRKLVDLQKDNEYLSEKVAHHELTVEYDMKAGLLYKKGTRDGPYCQVDQYQMTFEGYLGGELRSWVCPKCRHVARTS
jgi:hypothetical protein